MEQSRIFFGIPWRNFFGWILIGFVISLIFVNLTPNISNDSLMTVPVLILWALFPIIFGRILFQRNKILGFLATLPLSIFFSFRATIIINSIIMANFTNSRFIIQS